MRDEPKNISYPVMTFTSDHEGLNRAFRIALGDLYSSTILYQSGLMECPSPMIMAGLDYDDPWTRDAAINCWNGGSLLSPAIARNTLLGVLEENNGKARIGGQYWDKIIWVSAAWNHYLVTGDRDFLSFATQTALETLSELERDEFDEERNLFRGGACFQDGISGYPDRYLEGHRSSGPITRWAETNPLKRTPVGVGLPMMVGSTNCLYYAAYLCIAKMLKALGRSDTDQFEKKAGHLADAILAELWNSESAKLAYMVDPWGTCHHQEGLGISFAILFGILKKNDVDRAISAQPLTPQGIPCVWPSFERYQTPDGQGFGRHSGTVWPHVQGFWAEVVARHGRPDLMMNELLALANNSARDAQFTEIYHPETGRIYGGQQEHTGKDGISEWRSCRRQTWSATAFLRMIFAGLIGMRFDERGISFEPTLGHPIQNLHLTGLPYRNAVLDIKVTGCGQKIKSFLLNGEIKPEARIEATAEGNQQVRLILTER
jgi:glycogen debranching enzyme